MSQTALSAPAKSVEDRSSECGLPQHDRRFCEAGRSRAGRTVQDTLASVLQPSNCASAGQIVENTPLSYSLGMSDTTQWKTERRYAYDGVNVVADSGRGDSSWTWHVFQGYNRLALADKPGSALRVKYLLNDHLGTANVMVDDTGRVLAKYARDPWGNLESSWESTPLRWQFTGKEQDPEVGGNVFYFNARFYDAERGSFIGRDPKEIGPSMYVYASNAPLALIDPNGEAPEPATVITTIPLSL